MLDDPNWSAFAETALLTILNHATEGLAVFDLDGRCRMFGRTFGALFGVDPALQVGRSLAEVREALVPSCEEPELLTLAFGPPELNADGRWEEQIDTKQPRVRTLVCTTLPILEADTVSGRLILVQDVTRERSLERAQRHLQARLDHLIPTDPLTGLLNMRKFKEELEREHGRSTRAWDSYAVLRLDVIRMNVLNDTHGFAIGDSVLEQVADCLRRCRREYDVLARESGDDFLVLLPGADAVAAQAVAERMLKVVHEHDFELADGAKVDLHAAACVWVPRSPDGPTELVQRTLTLMKDARESKKIAVAPSATPTTT